jgi:hypothetical protein
VSSLPGRWGLGAEVDRQSKWGKSRLLGRVSHPTPGRPEPPVIPDRSGNSGTTGTVRRCRRSTVFPISAFPGFGNNPVLLLRSYCPEWFLPLCSVLDVKVFEES